MKKIYLTLFTFLASLSISQAQWTTGTDIYNINTGNIGVGTASPAKKLDVNGDGNYTGAVQIGNAKVNSNSTKLFIKNDWGTGKNWALSAGANNITEEGFHIYNWTDYASSPFLSINNSGSTVVRNTTGGTLTLEKSSTSIPSLIFQGVNSQSIIEAGDNYVTAFIGGTRRFTILANGNTGIGTNNPTEMLSVNGRIRAQEIKVETENWPDYVFKATYKLPTLVDVQLYIDKNKHLPDMPSEKEVVENGLNLGEMNKLLVQKIEELTLYLILQKEETDRHNAAQQQQINKLQKEVTKLTEQR